MMSRWKITALLVSFVVFCVGAFVISTFSGDGLASIITGISTIVGLLITYLQLTHPLPQPNPISPIERRFFTKSVLVSVFGMFCYSLYTLVRRGIIQINVGSVPMGASKLPVQSNQTDPPQSPGKTPSPNIPPKTKVLVGGGKLVLGDQLFSANEQFVLELADDARLLVKDITNGNVPWTNITALYPPNVTDLSNPSLENQTSDGNIVLYVNHHKSVWSTSTVKEVEPPQVVLNTLVVLNDGTLVVKNTSGQNIWSSSPNI